MTHSPMKRSLLTVAVAAMFAVTLATAPALADPVAGATYSGLASDYGDVVLTVSADGSTVVGYSVTNVHGSTCGFNANGIAGTWPGTPIVNGSFDYQIGAGFTFQGTFSGQSAHGTFQFSSSDHSGVAACDTGNVNWTAKTTATTPTGNGGGGGNGGGDGGTSGKGGAKQRKVQTRVAFGKLSASRLGGRLRSSSTRCVASRTVILWRGSHRVTTTHSKANGSYSFSRSRTLRGHKVHVQVVARTVASTICEAVSSGNVKA